MKMNKRGLIVLISGSMLVTSHCGGPKLQIKNTERAVPQLSRIPVSKVQKPIGIPTDAELFGAGSDALSIYEVETTLESKTMVQSFAIGASQLGFNKKILLAGPGTTLFGKPAVEGNSRISFEDDKFEGILNNHPLIIFASPSHSYPAANTAFEKNEVHPRNELFIRLSSYHVKNMGQEGDIRNLLGDSRVRKSGEEWTVFRRLTTGAAGLFGGGGNVFLTLRRYKAKGSVEANGKTYSVITYKSDNIIIEMISGELISSQAHFSQVAGVIVLDAETRQLAELTANVTFNTHAQGNVANPAFFLTQPEVLADMQQRAPSLDLANALIAGGGAGGALGSLGGIMAANSGGKITVETVALFKEISPDRIPALCEFGLKNSNYPAYYATPIQYEVYMHRQ